MEGAQPAASRGRRRSRVEVEAALGRRRISVVKHPLPELLDIQPQTLTLYISKSDVLSRAVWLYMLQTKLNFEVADVDDKAQEKLRFLQQTNLLGTVPALEDGDVHVFGCPAIFFYLAETYTENASMGDSAADHAKVESVMCWACNSLYRCVVMQLVGPQLREEDRGRLTNIEANMELIKRARETLTGHLQDLEQHYLGENTYLLGEKMTLADTLVAMLLTPLELVGWDARPYPLLRRWLQQVRAQHDQHWEEVSETHNMRVMQRGSRRASLT